MVDLNALCLPELFATLVANGCLDRLIDAAMEEDLGTVGDITTAAIGHARELVTARVAARRPGIVAGLAALPALVSRFSQQRVSGAWLASDGQPWVAGQSLATLSGRLHDVLALERTMLNLIGHLSGIATLTHDYVQAVAGTRAVICDTRKTTPGMRNLEKYAVRCGGGTLHRIGLFDAALFKDNHLAAIGADHLAPRLTKAIETIRAQHEVRFVEVEVDSIEQLQTILNMRKDLIDIVLLDNLTLEQVRQAVRLRDDAQPTLLLEASGGVNLDTVRSIAEAGVDRISVGALTHSAAALDVGLDLGE